MPAIWTSRQPWVRRPSGLVTLNRGSGLARRIVSAIDGRVDLARGLVGTAVGGGVVGTEIGLLPRYATAGQYLSFPHLAALDGAAAATFAFWVRPTTAHPSYGYWVGAIGGTVGSGGVGVGNRYGVGILANAGAETELYLAARNNDTSSSTTGAVLSTTAFTHVVARVVGGVAWRVWTNGVERSVTAGGGAPASVIGGNDQPFTIGRGENNSALDADGVIGLVNVWARALSDAEVRALWDQRTRWELYQPVVRRVVFDLAGGGGGETQKSSSDTLRLALVDAPSLAATVVGSDTAALSLSEVAALSAALAAAETLSLTVAEAATLAAQLAAADSLPLSLTETPDLAAQLAAADTLPLLTSESPSLDGSDAKAASDTLALVLSESASLAAEILGTDTLLVSVADGPALAAQLAAADTVALVVTESGAVATVDLVASSDTLTLALTELAALAAQIAGTDTLTVVLDEVPGLAATLASSETLAVALAHGSSVVIDGLVIQPRRLPTQAASRTRAATPASRTRARIPASES